MKITLLVVGKTKFSFWEEGQDYYSAKINRYCSFEMVAIKADKVKSNKTPISEIKKEEGVEICSKLSDKDYVILLDDKGKKYTSEQFAGHMQFMKETYVNKKIVFVVGGAYGFSDQVYSRCDEKMSLSSMTFSHQIIRVIFLEQLYRAFTIINGEPYHHV